MQHEHLYRLAVEQVADYAIFLLDSHGRAASWNAGVLQVLGWPESEWLGQPFAVTFPPEDVLNGEPERELEKARDSGCAEDDRWHVRRDGTKFWASGITTALRDDKGNITGFLKVTRDLTERRLADVRQETQLAVATVLAEAPDLKEAVPKLLRAICGPSGWKWGALWGVSGTGDVLRLVDAWSEQANPVPDFEQQSRRATFARGVGLPGSVWSNEQPRWVEDVTKADNFPRREAAMRSGLRGAFCFPVSWRGAVLAVMEFFSSEVRPPDAQLLGMMSVIGGQIGQFIDRKLTEEQLRAGEARIAAVVETALDCIVGMNHEGRVTEWNPAAERTFGYRRQEAMGREMASLIIPPVLRDRHRAGLAHYLATGEGPVLGRRFEIAAVRKDGAEFPVELTIIRLPGEGPPAFTGYIRDITDRKRAEEALRASGERLRRMVNIEGVGVLTFDAATGTLIDANEWFLAMSGYTREEVATRKLTWKTFTPPEHVEESLRQMDLLAARGRIGPYEKEYYRKDGSRLWMLFAGAGVGDGTVVEYCIDISDRKRAEAALRESEARLRAVFQQTEAGIAQVDLSGRFVLLNDRYAQIVGRTREELLGLRMQDITHPDDLPTNLALLQTSIRDGSPFVIEKRYVRPDGTDVWVSNSVSLIRGEGGEPTGVLAASVDITDRKRAEQVLRESEAHARRIIDNTLAFVGVMTPDGTLTEANVTALRAGGLMRDDVVGRKFWDCYWWSYDPQVQAQLREAVGRAASGEVVRYDVVVRMAGDTRMPIDFMLSPVRDERGRVTHLIPSGTDITVRKQAEGALRESEERLRLAISIAQMGTFEIDLRTDAVTVNDAGRDIYGWAPGEPLTFAKVQTHFHPDDREEVLQRVADAFRPDGPGEFEVEQRIVRTDGATRWIRVRGRAVYQGPEGERQAVRCVGTYLDVTPQKEAERQREQLLDRERAARTEAERASRMKDEFLATLSHELRTPLNAILGWATILKSGNGNENADDLAQGLETIERNARAQTQLIEDLLDMSRIISGKVRLDVQRVSLEPIIRAAVDTVTPAAEAKGIRVQAVLDPLAGPVSGDSNRLQQVFWNLLTNAIKFTPKGGRVQVLLERVNSHLEISVMDTGEGIRPEFLPHVFDRFRQADASTTRRHGGLGIGLSIVKQLVELHGGNVRAKSGGTGQGATFTVSLPLMVVHPEPERESARRHPRAGSESNIDTETCVQLTGLKVLVVDDEPDARTLLKRLLEECEAVVLTAASADEAMERIAAERPDVLVSDIGMPGEDGYSLIRRVRGLGAERGGSIPAIALTAYARSEDRTRSMLAGFQMHIGKPVERPELIAAIASIAGRTSAPRA